MSESWGALFQFNGRATVENGAELFDGLSGTLAAGVGHQFSESFRLGGGVFVSFRFERQAAVFPGIQMDWKFAEDWRFQILGPGAEFIWTPEDAWEFGLGISFDGRRFRLDDDATTDGSIVRERRVPITLRARWKARDDMSLGLEVGYDVDREYRIEDRNGRNSRSFDTDPGFFFGLRFSYTF